MIQIGAGAWGASWARVVAGSPHWELTALVDPDESALARAGDAARVLPERRFSSLREALAAVETDAVLIVVPPALHKDVALEALEMGLHCLIEKPLATSISEARELVKRGAEADRTLMASQNFRFGGGYRTVCGLVAEGAIGRVETVLVSFRRAPQFVGFRLEMEEPLIVDMAVHHLDQLRGLLRTEPTTVRARSYNPSWSPFRGNAATAIELAFGDGTIAFYDGSWVAPGPGTSWNGDWKLEGERGAIVWSDTVVELYPLETAPEGRLRRLAWRRRRRVPVAPLAEEGRAGVLAELAAAIGEGREPETSGRDNLATLELVFGAVESARTGEPVSLPG